MKMTRFSNMLSRFISRFERKNHYYIKCPDGKMVPDPERIYNLFRTEESKIKFGISTSMETENVPNVGLTVEKEKKPIENKDITEKDKDYEKALRTAIMRYAAKMCKDDYDAEDKLCDALEKIDSKIVFRDDR